jgi:hypothetical protein
MPSHNHALYVLIPLFSMLAIVSPEAVQAVLTGIGLWEFLNRTK